MNNTVAVSESAHRALKKAAGKTGLSKREIATAAIVHFCTTDPRLLAGHAHKIRKAEEKTSGFSGKKVDPLAVILPSGNGKRWVAASPGRKRKKVFKDFTGRAGIDLLGVMMR